jgi:hypothetical protein
MLTKLTHPNVIKIFPHENQYSNVVIMEMELGLMSVLKYSQNRRQANNPLREEEVAAIMKGVL